MAKIQPAYAQSAARRLGDLSGSHGLRTRRTPPATAPQSPVRRGEYATQLQEKQKAKFIYGVMEKQFHNYYLKAEKMAGKTGENLLIAS